MASLTTRLPSPNFLGSFLSLACRALSFAGKSYFSNENYFFLSLSILLNPVSKYNVLSLLSLCFLRLFLLLFAHSHPPPTTFFKCNIWGGVFFLFYILGGSPCSGVASGDALGFAHCTLWWRGCPTCVSAGLVLSSVPLTSWLLYCTFSLSSTGFCAQLLSRVRLFAALWTIACQVLLSMEFSRQEYWSGLPFSAPGDLPDSAFVSIFST